MARAPRMEEVAKAEIKSRPNDDRIRVDPKTGSVGVGAPDFQLAEHVTVRNVLSGLDNALLDLSDRLETLEKALIPVLEQELDAEQDWEPEMARPASMDAPVIGDIRRMRAFAEAMTRHVVDLTGRVQV